MFPPPVRSFMREVERILAAIRVQGEAHRTELERQRTRLGLNPADYVNAGVLVINVRQCQKEHTADVCFEVLRTTPHEQPLSLDQDILNMVCRDRIYYLDERWNFLWHMVYGAEEFVRMCRPVAERIKNDFYILHFSSGMKPWEIPQVALSGFFWKYARTSPFYEEIIVKNCCDMERKT